MCLSTAGVCSKRGSTPKAEACIAALAGKLYNFMRNRVAFCSFPQLVGFYQHQSTDFLSSESISTRRFLTIAWCGGRVCSDIQSDSLIAMATMTADRELSASGTNHPILAKSKRCLRVFSFIPQEVHLWWNQLVIPDHLCDFRPFSFESHLLCCCCMFLSFNFHCRSPSGLPTSLFTPI